MMNAYLTLKTCSMYYNEEEEEEEEEGLTNNINHGSVIGESSCRTDVLEIHSIRKVICFSDSLTVVVVAIVCKWVPKDEVTWDLWGSINMKVAEAQD